MTALLKSLVYSIIKERKDRMLDMHDKYWLSHLQSLTHFVLDSLSKGNTSLTSGQVTNEGHNLYRLCMRLMPTLSRGD